jgi:hypothetical protein
VASSSRDKFWRDNHATNIQTFSGFKLIVRLLITNFYEGYGGQGEGSAAYAEAAFQ